MAIETLLGSDTISQGKDKINNNFTYSVPAGGIIMWSGSLTNIPSGWALCDGSSGTPNLVDRFIVGAGSTYSVNDIGGEDTHTLSASEMPSHSHTFSANTSSAGAHSHSLTGNPAGWGAGPNNQGRMRVDANSPANNWNQSTNSTGAHTHSINGTTSASGSNTAHENRPPYFALAFIMKL